MRRLLCLLAALVGLAAAPVQAEPLSEQEAYEIGREAYVYLFPLVVMDLTRQLQVTAPADGARVTPANRFRHLRAFPPGDFREVVRPNFDTLYSIAWIDVAAEPVVLSVKPGIDRYYLLPLMDMWTDVFATPGERTLGREGGDFAIVAKGWRGTLPKGMQRLEAPTSSVWLIGRIQTNGVADYAHVAGIQDGFGLTPLSGWGKPPSALPAPVVDRAVDRVTPPARQMMQMPADRFFARAAALLAANPPHDVDQPVITRMARAGLVAGRPFELSAAPPQVAAGFARGAADARALILGSMARAGSLRNGWRFHGGHQGAYGGDYLFRAAIALAGLGANRAEDAIYPSAFTDAEGKPLHGDNRYRLHFAKDQLPPNHAFWSITAYDAEGFTTPNAIGRYAIGDRDALAFNPDGSLDILLQADDPGGAKAANWLPVPRAGFNLALRIYNPGAEAMDGRWSPPAVAREP